MNKSYAELSQRLQYAFKAPDLLVRALTHRSKSADNYERLEFLGDSVLGFAISAELYQRYPNLTEGELTRLRASLVKQQTLAQLARGLELGDYLVLGEGELKSGGSDRDSILADTLEAVLGAICRDGTVEQACEVIRVLYRDLLAQLDPQSIPKDPKTQLQEYLQKHSLPTPVYEIRAAVGEPHNQKFTVTCRVAGLTDAVCGEGSSRRIAEQQAATTALARLTGNV